jgi:hypothetical protein
MFTVNEQPVKPAAGEYFTDLRVRKGNNRPDQRLPYA